MKKHLDVKSDKDLYVGKAFMTLEKQSQAVHLADKFEMHSLIRATFFVYYKLLKCKKSKIERRYWDGERIIVERAAEPGDVYWENLSVTPFQRLKNILLTYTITTILLAFVFGFYYSLHVLKKFLEDEAENKQSENNSNYLSWLVRLVSIFNSIIVVLVNLLLHWLIRLLSSYEKHMTYTKFRLSVATKLMIATFVNSAILPLINNLEMESWFDDGGLVTTIFYNVISISFVTPLLNVFSITYFLRRFRMWREFKKGIESKLTQRQANDLFEGPNIDMASRYAQTGLLLLIVSFYTPMQPILPIIALAGTFFQYWVEKYLLLRRYSIPEAMGSTMARFYAGIIPIAMLLYSISNYVFLRDLSDKKNNHGQASLWFMIGYVVLPVKLVLKLVTDSISRDDSLVYSKVKYSFIQDYDRCNPMTANKAKAK